MMHKHTQYYFQHLKNDIPAGIVVFLVALPLCLGIALASGAPLFSGLIGGLVGGLVVSWLSGSELAVSGPAAGLTLIIFNGIETLGSFQAMLVACMLAGIVQLGLGFLRAGIISAFFPSSVIEGMMAAIGLILIIKQIPHATGYHTHYEGDESYMMDTAKSSFIEIFNSFSGISLGSLIISIGSLLLLILWNTPWFKSQTLLKIIPGQLVAVIWGIVYNLITRHFAPKWTVSSHHLVRLPVSEKITDFFNNFVLPDAGYLSHLGNPHVYTVAITIAIIASLETLLSLQATDKLDPLKRLASTNRELKAQGVGNIISGLLGGLPITTVIVRSAASINAGGQTRVACFTHGVFLLLSVMFFANYLNYIPLASLAAILLHTGYKLANPVLFKKFYQRDMSQFLPFVITVIAILVTDLLKGLAIGIVIGIFFVIKANYHAAITLIQDGSHYQLALNKDISFLNQALLRKFFLSIPRQSTVTIDASNAKFIDHDILETIENFLVTAPDNNIIVKTIDLYGKQEVKKHEALVILNDRAESETQHK